MVVNDLREEDLSNGFRLSAAIHSENLKPTRLWFEFTSPAPLNMAHPQGDPFLAAALPIAMRLGEPLLIEAPVSNSLIQNARTISEIYRAWIPGSSKIDMACPAHEPAPRASGKGCFFSCGIDSFYSFLKHRGSISHLVTVHGFDIFLENDLIFEQLRDSVRQVVDAEGVTPIWVKSNVRELSDPVVSWGMYHGAAAAAVALALQGTLGVCLIGSSYAYADLAPWGTHPLLDPLWSNGSLTVAHDGCEATRIEKIAAVSAYPVAMKTLRVCCHDPGSYNCGKCEKCLRTMIGLHVCGALGRCSTLPGALAARQLAEIPIDSERVAAFLREAEASLGNSGVDAGYGRALRDALERWTQTELERGGGGISPENGAVKRAGEEIASLRNEVSELRLANETLAAELLAIRRSITWRYGLKAGAAAQRVLRMFGVRMRPASAREAGL